MRIFHNGAIFKGCLYQFQQKQNIWLKYKIGRETQTKEIGL